MKWYTGSSSPPKGTYFNPRAWEYVYVDKGKIAVLSGEVNDKYLKIPIGLSLITGPIGGLFLVIFIPLAGIIGMIYYIVTKIKRVFSKSQHANSVKPE